jgi:hypothetical protein
MSHKMNNIIHTLEPWDILSGRRRSAYHNVGNRRFRITISLNCQRYLDAPSKHEKSEVITSILSLLKNEVGARFFKPCDDGIFYVEISELEAREKIAHALRDMTASSKSTGEKGKKRPPGTC